MSERFPEIDWYCDHCNAYLNGQDNFDDHKYIWKCKECGFKNSISRTNILENDGEDEPEDKGFLSRFFS